MVSVFEPDGGTSEIIAVLLFHSLFNIANCNSLPHFPLKNMFSIKCPSCLNPVLFNKLIEAVFAASTISTTRCISFCSNKNVTILSTVSFA